MRQPSRDSGFTLIEVMVTVVLFGMVVALGAGAYGKWADAASQASAAQEIQTVLRGAQQRAVTEGVAMCVDFDAPAGQYTVFRHACEDARKERLMGPLGVGSGVQLVSPTFGGDTGVTFEPRGTATAGQVVVAREDGDASTSDTIRVVGLTGYVELED